MHATFPFLFGGTFIEGRKECRRARAVVGFPFLFGGTFIEGIGIISLGLLISPAFPFLFGGTFIEGTDAVATVEQSLAFPFLFGGTFIEGREPGHPSNYTEDFPSFSEGLSLRDFYKTGEQGSHIISLPFRRDFH